MAVDSSTSVMDSLLEKLKLDDPLVPPRSWDSVPYQQASTPLSDPLPALYPTSMVSEFSLVRQALNALQGVESALISIQKLSALFHCSSADRTSNRIPRLWTKCSSTTALANLLISIGQFGCLAFLLQRFVKYFTAADIGGVIELQDNLKGGSCGQGTPVQNNCSLIDQAFAISVGKVMDGYISALNTLSPSSNLRCFSKTDGGGCLTCIGHSEITILEVYLHTMELRTQIEALGNICNVAHLIDSFPVSSIENLKTKAESEFNAFPRRGALLSYLYAQLKIAGPENCALLKFLFVRSYEPYSDFVRSWIYDGSVSDPYNEFVVECINKHLFYESSNNGISCGSPLPTVRVREEVDIPCFLEECLIPLCRTGQQLQVIIKLLELSNNIATCHSYEEVFPSLVGLSNEYPWFDFPLTFEKEAIETMALARANYYQQKLEKVESILTKFDFSFQQAASQTVQSRLLNNLKMNPNHHVAIIADADVFSSPKSRRDQYITDTTVDAEVLSTMDEYSYSKDHFESSDCSSSEAYEEQNEVGMMNLTSSSAEPTYVSALDFFSSTNNSMENLGQNEILYALGGSLSKKNWESGCTLKDMDPLSRELQLSGFPEKWVMEHDLCLFDDNDVVWMKNGTFDHQLELSMEDCGLVKAQFGDSAISTNASCTGGCASSKSFYLHISKLNYDSTIFSLNPSLNQSPLFHLRSILGERAHANYKYPFFDFTSVIDPLEACDAKLAGDHRPKFGMEPKVITETSDAGFCISNRYSVEVPNDVIMENGVKSCNISSPVHKMGRDNGRVLLPNISGASAWESLLGRSGKSVSRSARDFQTKLVLRADMPLDFVIKKCMLYEILLQYNYVSKLTIKLLIEGFKLQEHLQALRCYHFMELADWADLFINSLWGRKWLANDVDKRIPEIQGVLELAVLRSSCERDPNKERLYVYQKGDKVRDSSTSFMGIHSFDFLGLGYQIDWPVNIILTPDALDIYSEIFNFLMQVKLAVFSLSDVWCSLKGLHFEHHKGETHHISVISETRHKLHHFVCTLQQYIQSQISQVSWYRFLQALKHKISTSMIMELGQRIMCLSLCFSILMNSLNSERISDCIAFLRSKMLAIELVKDMLDLESVHTAYLAESLHACFLSDETQSVAGIIQSILQCAIDFRSCLNGMIMEYPVSEEKMANRFSHHKISEVHCIRRVFEKNIEELYLLYLHYPKHGEYGLPRFWDHLNYNEYYAGAMSRKMGSILPT